ncbi:MAG: hypothetical protein J6L91_05945 [Clostridia bacterium]|nr:hypothetical protein [Clostridia bacterium]
MGNNIIRIVATMFVGMIIKTLIDFIRQKDGKDYVKCQPLRVPKLSFYVGFAVSCIIPFMLFICAKDGVKLTDEQAVTLILPFLLLAGLGSFYLCSVYFNFRVEYDDEKFIKTSCFRRKSTVYYHEITKIAYSNSTFYVYTGTKRHRVTPACIGFQDFLAKLQSKTGLRVETI